MTFFKALAAAAFSLELDYRDHPASKQPVTRFVSAKPTEIERGDFYAYGRRKAATWEHYHRLDDGTDKAFVKSERHTFYVKGGQFGYRRAHFYSGSMQLDLQMVLVLKKRPDPPSVR